MFAFAIVGKGTTAPFDPPRRLVAQGPYRVVRNPIYVGAGLTLVAAALFFQSVGLLAYTGIFLLIAHLMVVFHEEPRLEQTFGDEYAAYCNRVGRWWPKM